MTGSTFICALNSLDIAPQNQLIITLGDTNLGAQFSQIQGVIHSIHPANDIPGNYILKLRVTSAANVNSIFAGQLIANISVASIVSLAHNPIVDNWPSDYTSFF